MKSSGNNRRLGKNSLLTSVLLVALTGLPGLSLMGNALGEDPEKNIAIFDPVPRIGWYPSDRKELAVMVNSYISDAKTNRIKGKIMAVIAPHAGFRYSGRGAAYAFKPLMKRNVNRVIILAPSHMGGFRGLSILKADYYGTPLGLIKIDTAICDSLLKERKHIIKRMLF